MSFILIPLLESDSDTTLGWDSESKESNGL